METWLRHCRHEDITCVRRVAGIVAVPYVDEIAIYEPENHHPGPARVDGRRPSKGHLPGDPFKERPVP